MINDSKIYLVHNNYKSMTVWMQHYYVFKARRVLFVNIYIFLC